MRLDIRFPLPVLLDHTWQVWEREFLHAWLTRPHVREWDCNCHAWTPRIPDIEHLSHWQYHGLLLRLDELLARIEHHHTDPEDGPGAEAIEQVARFDALVDPRLADLPAQIGRLIGQCRVTVGRPRTGVEAFGTILDRFMTAVAPDKPAHGGEHPRTRIARTPSSADSDPAEHAVRRLYRALGFPEPVVIRVESPRQAEALATLLLDAAAALAAEDAGIAEIELHLVLATQRNQISADTVRQARAVLTRLVESDEPATQFLPISSDVEPLRVLALLHLAARLSYDAEALTHQLNHGFAPDLLAQLTSRDGPLVSHDAVAWELERSDSRPVLALPTDERPRLDPFEGLRTVGPHDVPGVAEILTLRDAVWAWSGMRGVVLLIAHPTDVVLDPGGRPHCETGPAVRWSDGWALHYWHGRVVPAGLIEHGWDVNRILAEPNTEIRRCAIERMGWDKFVRLAQLRRLGGSAPDPANPGQVLELYEIPRGLLDRVGVNILLCTNASEERDGTRRRFGLMVPADIDHPVAAAAWTFGLTREQYEGIEAAT